MRVSPCRVELASRPGLRGRSIQPETLSGADRNLRILPDLMLDSSDRGVVELRVRAEAGAKGMRPHRVPVVPKLGRSQDGTWRASGPTSPFQTC